MGLLVEWRELRAQAERAMDDLAHLDAVTIHARAGARPAVVHAAIELGGDTETWIGGRADAAPELAAIHTNTMDAMVTMHAARLGLVTGIVRALL